MAVKNLNLPVFPPFNCSGEDTSILYSSWKRYIKRFNLLCSSLVVTDDKQKLSLLLTLVGDEAYEIYENIMPDPEGKTFADTVQAFEEHFKPQVNTSYETFLFRKLVQREDETIQQYYVRLHEQAVKCDFADKDKEIKQQIELSTSSTKLRKYSFQNPGKSLSELLTIAKTFETMKIQTEDIEKHAEQEAINKLSKKQLTNTADRPYQDFKQNKPSKTCYRCGGEFPHARRCAAIGKTCHSCGKPDHFATVCRSSQPSRQPQMGRNQRRGDYQKPLNSIHETDLKPSTTEEEPSDSLFKVNCQTEGKVKKQDFKVKVLIEKSEIELLIDTGASINVLNESTFEAINKKLKTPLQLKKSKAKLVTYGNDTPDLKIKGEVILLIESKQRILHTKFYVIKTHHKNLLSGSTATALELISINNVETAESSAMESATQEIPKHLQETIQRYKKTVFSGKIGKLDNYQVKLKINKDVTPIAQRERRLPFAMREKVKAELQKLEDAGIIETVTDEPTPWISPMVVVPKSNGEIRICIDMRGPNTAIERTRYPTPTLDDLMYKLKDATVFTKLDLKSAFHQLELTEDSRYITTFQTESGIKRFTRLSLGVNSAQEELQHAIREIIKDIQGTMNLADDIVVHGKNQTEHDASLLKILHRFEEKGLTLNLEKCLFSLNKLKFFGFVFSDQGMHPDPEKLDQIKNMAAPEDTKALQSFLGLMNYFKRFIPQYSTITYPLRQLLHKDTKWSWSNTCQTAFDKLRNSLTSESCLSYFDPKKETTVYTDASPVGVSAVIVQNTPTKQDHKLISYTSRSLTPTEQRYSQIERECLAIVYACEHNKLYLYGHNFKIFCDHKPIVNLLNKPNSVVPLRIERMTLRLQGYDFDLHHVKGVENISDYPSRHPFSEETDDSELEEYVQFIASYACPNALSIEEIQQETLNDPVLQIVADLIRTNTWYKLEQSHRFPEIKKHLQKLSPYRNIKDQLTVNANSDLILKANRIIIPESYENAVIQLSHEGHLGLTKMKSLLRSKVYFPNMDSKTEHFLKHCAACQVQSKPAPPAKLAVTPTPNAVWEKVNIDYLGPLPNGFYLVVIVDQLSKFPIVEPIRNTSADLLIDFLQRTIATFGIFQTIVSDNGPPFKSYKLKQFFHKLKIKHQRITPLWPQANAQAESFMKPLMKSVRAAYINRNNWKKELQNFLFSYRSTPHCSTKLPPSTLMFRRHTNFTIPAANTPVEENIHQQARERLEESKLQRKEYHDKRTNAKDRDIHIGDNVIVKQRKSNKLSPTFEPRQYEVVAKNNNMITARDTNGNEKTRNISHYHKIPPIQFNENEEQEPPDVPDQEVAQRTQPERRRNPPRERRPVQFWRYNMQQ